ncbi:MAG TPA: hypothetical protein VGU25_05340 [Acidobacteriaceae bacterium]|nr:hypothetical protein [Acidobacteriaceae bacterium]
MGPREINHILRVGALCAAVLVVSGAGLNTGSGVVHAQKNPQPKIPPYMQQGPDGLSGNQPAPDPVHAKMEQERMKAMNDDRHKKLAADVDRLLALTNELKTDVDKTNKDELSVEVIKKAGEIEKLAHDVQSRMKN